MCARSLDTMLCKISSGTFAYVPWTPTMAGTLDEVYDPDADPLGLSGRRTGVAADGALLPATTAGPCVQPASSNHSGSYHNVTSRMTNGHIPITRVLISLPDVIMTKGGAAFPLGVAYSLSACMGELR